jgi:hypothetical protein
LISRKIAVLCLIVQVVHGYKRIRLTWFANDNSVPGSKQTATYLFSGAENPRVWVLNKRVVSRSPTLAGRDWTLSRL